MKNKNYHDHKRLGLCVRCCEKSEIGKIYCPTHAEKERERQRRKHAQRKNDGQCRYCTKQPLPGRALCAKHLESVRNRSKMRRKLNKPSEKITILTEVQAVATILALRSK